MSFKDCERLSASYSLGVEKHLEIMYVNYLIIASNSELLASKNLSGSHRRPLNTMNAMLTWWGVSIAIINNDSLGSGVLSREALLSIVPLFVAILVWLIRVLMIGTFALAGERLFSQVEENPLPNKVDSSRSSSRHMPVTARTRAYPAPEAIEAASIQTYRPAPKPINHGSVNHHPQEPEYQPVPVTAQSRNSGYQPEFSNH